MTPEEAQARLSTPGSRFEIGEEIVLGEPMNVFVNRHRSLGELMRRSVEFGDRPYLMTAEDEISFVDHYRDVAALATALRDEYGVAQGDRVAVCMENRTEWIVAFWATVTLGAVVVGVNSLWAGPEMHYGLELTDPKVLIADAARLRVIGQTDVPTIEVDRDLPGLLSRHAGAELPDVAVDEDDPAMILFTSGTTGRPKGATHSHRNMIAAVWYHLFNDAVSAELGNPLRDRRYLLVTPMFHVAGLHNIAVIRLAIGDTAVIHLGRFVAEKVVALVEQRKVTNWGSVPTMLSRILDLGDRLADYDLSSLRTVTVQSAPSSGQLLKDMARLLPSAGPALATSYGLTESTTAATMARAEEFRKYPKSVGKAVPTMEVEVRDEKGHKLPDGVEGEVCLRGPLMMLGYWDNPEATAASTAPGRWFRTGDLGTLVDGRLSLSSRRSDLILRGGENVYPAEIEGLLAEHPEVRECAVVGLPHRDLGEEVGCVAVVQAESDVSASDLHAFLTGRIAKYKIPSRWSITTTELPRTALGKIVRTGLDEAVLAGCDRADA